MTILGEGYSCQPTFFFFTGRYSGPPTPTPFQRLWEKYRIVHYSDVYSSQNFKDLSLSLSLNNNIYPKNIYKKARERQTDKL